jgi:tetratricopeptide (TPR) repeat protein
VYNGILAADTKNQRAVLRLANIYEQLRNIDAAIRLLDRFISKNPNDKDVKIFLCQLLLKEMKWEESVSVLSSLDHAEVPLAAFFLGYAFYMLDEFEIAKNNLLSFLQYNDNTDFVAEAYNMLAKINIELELYDEALENARYSEKIFRNNWELFLIFTIIYYNKQMYYHAVINIEKALKLSKNNQELYIWAGKAYYKYGDYTNAEKYLLECLNSEDIAPEVYTFLGLTCLNGKKSDEAVKYLDIALSLDPENQDALNAKKNATIN